MHILTRFALRRASIIVMIMVLVLFGGVYSMFQLKSELLPNIDLPVVSVITIYPGAAPDDVRRDVTQPIEKIVAGSANLKSLNSTSSDSVSIVTAQYEYGTDTEKEQQNVQEALNSLSLPSQVQRPTAGRFNFQDIPILEYTVNTSSTDPNALTNLRSTVEDKIVPDLKSVSGVNSVRVAGGGTLEVQITFDSKKLQKAGLTASSVTGILQANNISFPTGQIVNNGESLPVRVIYQFGSLDDLRNVVVRPAIPAGTGSAIGAAGSASGGAQGSNAGAAGAGGVQSGQGTQGTTVGNGAQGASTTPAPAVKLSDVATVALANVSGQTISRSNGKPTLSLLIYKAQNANTVQVADDVNAKLDSLIQQLPGTQRQVLFDQSSYIKDSLNGLIREGVLGAILAIAVILVFLSNFSTWRRFLTSLRSTLVVALSIPLSILIALMLLNVLNISLNIMSLAGLAVAIGRVVDDSIVVLENIYRHHFQNREPLRQAAFNGTREVATAITSSTITTVCVFLPLGIIAGLVSEFFRPFAVAVSVALLASLFVALTVIPMLAAIFLRVGRSTELDFMSHTDTRDTLVQRLYTPVITWALSRRWTKLATLGVALLLFAGSMLLATQLGTTFLSFGSDKVLNVTLSMKPGTDITTTSNVSAAVESQLQKNPDVTNYEMNAGANTSGAAASGGFGSGVGSDSQAALTVTYKRDADIKAEADSLRAVIKNLAAANPTLQDYKVVASTGSGGFNSSNFALVISGSDYNDVLTTSNTLMNKLKTVPDLVNLTSDAATAKQEVRIRVDPAAALAHGSTTVQIATQVRGLLTSQNVTQITINNTQYDVVAAYDPSTLNNVDAIKGILVGTVNPVPLSQVADVGIENGPVSITAVNQQRAITLSGTINSDSISGVNTAAKAAIDSTPHATSTNIAFGGSTQLQGEAFGQLFTALAVAIILVYMVMVVTFGSLSTPFIIMFSLPLAAIGSILALYFTGRPLGVSALIGVLMLVGIVVTNAIVLLDLVEHLKHERGLSTHDALVQGGRTRVRPIVMTALATMIALLPLVLGFSEGSIIASELGTVVVGGLFTSTFLTLIVVPVVYSLLDSVRTRLGAGRRRELDEEDLLPGETAPQHEGLAAPATPEPVGVG